MVCEAHSRSGADRCERDEEVASQPWTVGANRRQGEEEWEVSEQETRQTELVGQLERLRDLYVMGDLSKSEYVLRRQALEDELSRTRPPFDPKLDEAEELLADFGRIWALEDDPAKRRRLLATLFDRIWQDGGTIVAVKPREAFLRYFRAADELARRRDKKRGVKSGSDGGRSVNLRTTASRSADARSASVSGVPVHRSSDSSASSIASSMVSSSPRARASA